MEPNVRELTDKQLIELYDNINSEKSKLEKVLKSIHKEAKNRLKEKGVSEVVYYDANSDKIRGYKLRTRTNRRVNYKLLKELVKDKYNNIIIESETVYVQFIKRKSNKNTESDNIIHIPEAMML